MNFAIIGCGRISTNHIKASSLNKLNIVALCDLSVKNIDVLLEKHDLLDSNIKKYTDYKTMISENNIDLVAIATESGNHSEISLYCIEKGIHCIIEKPIAMSLADGRKIIELSNEKNVKVTVCHQNRFNIAVKTLNKAIKEDRLGKLSHGSINVRWNRNKNYYTQAPWRGTWENDGGCLLNQCIHGIDLLLYSMGDQVDEVYGTTRQRFHDYLEAEDVGLGIVKFKNGSVATIEGSTNVYPQNLEETLYIFGETGTVKLGGKSTNDIEVWNLMNETQEDTRNKMLKEETENVYGNGHIGLYADIINAVKTDTTPYITAQDGVNALEVILAIYKSQKTGLPVKFPLENFSTIEMKGEF